MWTAGVGSEEWDLRATVFTVAGGLSIVLIKI